MNTELLLSWMTHTGTGRWASFRSRVAELSGATDEDLHRVCRGVRIALSDLGHVDFFVDGGRRWRVRQPVLAGLAGMQEAMFTGGRVPRLLTSLREIAAHTPGCEVQSEPLCELPGIGRVVVAGEAETLASLAEALGLRFLPDAAASLAASQPAIASVVAEAPERPEPVNWEVHSWSFEDLAWIPGKLRKTAQMYVNRHGKRRHLVDLGGSLLREMDKYDAVFAAAWRTQRPLVQYDHADGVLRTPRMCPLPEGFSRAACLASGRTASLDGDHLIYAGVPQILAWMILHRLGQPVADRMVCQ